MSHPPDSSGGAEYRRIARRGRTDKPVRVGRTTVGGGSFCLIAGPCAVESKRQIRRTARLVADAGASLLRGGAFKPRTSPYDFQGTGLEGVEAMRTAADEADLPLVTEVPSAAHVEPMAPLVDAFQIGARNMQNFELLRAVGEFDKPVLLKRSFGATLTEWLLAAEYIADAGNTDIILCERGIRSFGDELRFTLDLAGAVWAKRESLLPIVVDPSHATGAPGLIAPLVAASRAAGLDGAMLEVHPDPQQALCDGEQALDTNRFAALVERLIAPHTTPLADGPGTT